MTQYLIAYAFTAVVFLGIDYIWLTRVAKTFYFDRLGDIILDSPRMGAAVGFYAIYVVGILIFAVLPALKSGNLGSALIYGALFGFFAYGTYDMTNYATLRSWSLTVSAVDMAWGTVLTGTAAFLGTWLTRIVTSAS
ncbi:MAG: DUF2177 family protein [Rhodobacteraceae bacterium]|nr:DUF2177 family protein [Paracoccaceae bacterium]